MAYGRFRRYYNRGRYYARRGYSAFSRARKKWGILDFLKTKSFRYGAIFAAAVMILIIAFSAKGRDVINSIATKVAGVKK